MESRNLSKRSCKRSSSFCFVKGVIIVLKMHISKGNQKMGSIPSVSLPSVSTCRVCNCNIKCYAKKIERLRPNVASAYRENFLLFTKDPDEYWRKIEGCIMMNRFFRFHVGGDIVNYEYLTKMVEVASRNPSCNILCFTKKDYLVNMYIRDFGDFPTNLHIILSAWEGLTIHNPYRLPEAHVLYKNGERTTAETVTLCPGNCTECAITNGGCWNLKKGEKIQFNEH